MKAFLYGANRALGRSIGLGSYYADFPHFR